MKDVAGEVTVATNGSSNVAQVATNLDASTKYEYRLLQNDTNSEPEEFTTEDDIQLPNSGFEDWYTDSDGLPKPAKDASSSFWDCGNVNYFGKHIMTTQNDETALGQGSSVKMETQETMKIIAAGNIFTGTFERDGMGGILTLGRNFECRPNKLKGYYKYTSAKVSVSKGHLNEGEDDLCSLYIALTDEQITVNTNKGIYFDPNSSAVIAYGSISDEESKGADSFKEFTVDLEYKDLKRIPKYIIVVASSSKYGDYMEGGKGSTMWLDDLELVYPKSMEEVRK